MKFIVHFRILWIQPANWTSYALGPLICGSDGLDYRYIEDFQYKQKTKYRKRVKLQLRHRGGCWILKKCGYEDNKVLLASNRRIDSISILYSKHILNRNGDKIASWSSLSIFYISVTKRKIIFLFIFYQRTFF